MVYQWTRAALNSLQRIEPYEVRQALESTTRWPRLASSPDGLVALTIWGRSAAGRPLIVAVRRLEGWDWLILGARDMRIAERAEFVRWEEKRRG